MAQDGVQSVAHVKVFPNSLLLNEESSLKNLASISFCKNEGSIAVRSVKWDLLKYFKCSLPNDQMNVSPSSLSILAAIIWESCLPLSSTQLLW